jgi:hypothetical protein
MSTRYYYQLRCQRTKYHHDRRTAIQNQLVSIHQQQPTSISMLPSSCLSLIFQWFTLIELTQNIVKVHHQWHHIVIGRATTSGFPLILMRLTKHAFLHRWGMEQSRTCGIKRLTKIASTSSLSKHSTWLQRWQARKRIEQNWRSGALCNQKGPKDAKTNIYYKFRGITGRPKAIDGSTGHVLTKDGNRLYLRDIYTDDIKGRPVGWYNRPFHRLISSYRCHYDNNLPLVVSAPSTTPSLSAIYIYDVTQQGQHQSTTTNGSGSEDVVEELRRIPFEHTINGMTIPTRHNNSMLSSPHVWCGVRSTGFYGIDIEHGEVMRHIGIEKERNDISFGSFAVHDTFLVGVQYGANYRLSGWDIRAPSSSSSSSSLSINEGTCYMEMRNAFAPSLELRISFDGTYIAIQYIGQARCGIIDIRKPVGYYPLLVGKRQSLNQYKIEPSDYSHVDNGRLMIWNQLGQLNLYDLDHLFSSQTLSSSSKSKKSSSSCFTSPSPMMPRTHDNPVRIGFIPVEDDDHDGNGSSGEEFWMHSDFIVGSFGVIDFAI